MFSCLFCFSITGTAPGCKTQREDEKNRLKMSTDSILEGKDIVCLSGSTLHSVSPAMESLEVLKHTNSCSGPITDRPEDHCQNMEIMTELTTFQRSTDTAVSRDLHGSSPPHRDRMEDILPEDKETLMASEKSSGSLLQLHTLEVEACPSSTPHQDHAGPTTSPAATQQGERATPETDPDPVLKAPEHGGEASEGQWAPGPSRLLLHIADDGSPLPSPRCPSLSQSQRFHSDPETAPSPPCSQPFIKARSISRTEFPEASSDAMSITLLTRHIQTLKRKIRRFEESFERERHYRPSHNDKTASPEVFQLMSELAKSRKQLRELRLKQSVQQLKVQKLEEHTEPGIFRNGGDQQRETEQSQKPSLEETVEVLKKRLREKRQALGLPDNMKEMSQKQMAMEKITLQKCLLYFESQHGRPGTRQERSLMKPLYDRYRTIKQLLCTASSITTIMEEEGSDEDCIQRRSQQSCRLPRPQSQDEMACPQDEDSEPTFVSPLDEVKTVRQPALTMSNLHEASRSELLECLRETRVEKRRLRKALREFEDHFYRQMGRTAQKDDRIPMAEEYQEYKNLKAKLRLLEALLSKQETPKII
ncbi:hypothetical protein JZ751_018520 [Albula glossodonta]|uniref:FAM13A-like domain-containing protein n=1 Tax=Albula glossodonta TaxID=121402 RepID=A0A8T2NWF0_9TELE|nr:hypothetical protein JZ751_018520 [Albula glossodonta]